MRALEERVEALARDARRRRVERIADEWRSVPEARVDAGADEVTIEARGLGRRWLAEPMLRFAGRAGR